MSHGLRVQHTSSNNAPSLLLEEEHAAVAPAAEAAAAGASVLAVAADDDLELERQRARARGELALGGRQGHVLGARLVGLLEAPRPRPAPAPRSRTPGRRSGPRVSPFRPGQLRRHVPGPF